jgi:hypothetical protein
MSGLDSASHPISSPTDCATALISLLCAQGGRRGAGLLRTRVDPPCCCAYMRMRMRMRIAYRIAYAYIHVYLSTRSDTYHTNESKRKSIYPSPIPPRLPFSLSLSLSHPLPHPRSTLITRPLHAAEPKVLFPALAPLVAKLLVELFDRAQTRHVFRDAGADFLERLVEVPDVQRAFRGERVRGAAHEVKG